MRDHYPEDRYDLKYGNQYRSGLEKLTFWDPTRYEFLIAGMFATPITIAIAMALYFTQ